MRIGGFCRALGALWLVTVIGCPTGTKLHVITMVPVPGGMEVREKAVWVRAEKETIELSPNVKSVTRITDFKGERDAYSPKVSPDDRWVAFEIREGRAVRNLWSVDTSGSRAMVQLTNSPVMNIRPYWSPDSQFIYFASNRIGYLSHIYRIRSGGGGGITQLTSSTTWDSAPSVSRIGGKIAFTAVDSRDVEKEVWIVNTDGSFLTQMLRGMGPAWSPDGQRVAYLAKQRPDSRELYLWTMRADGSERTQITYAGREQKRIDDWWYPSPSWSPDGRWLAFASDRGKDRKGKRNFDIWAVRPDASGLTQLTTNGSHDACPTWGPDGRHIYFQSNRGLSWDIWRMEVALPR